MRGLKNSADQMNDAGEEGAADVSALPARHPSRLDETSALISPLSEKEGVFEPDFGTMASTCCQTITSKKSVRWMLLLIFCVCGLLKLGRSKESERGTVGHQSNFRATELIPIKMLPVDTDMATEMNLGLSSTEINSEEAAFDAVRSTGIDLVNHGNAILWTGEKGGNNKPRGPLLGRKVGVILASEFSDFQAYYLVSYIGELGGVCEFLLVDWVKWKFVRPNVANKGVRGMWDLSVDPIPVMGGNKAALFKGLKDANPKDYDALIVIGGHSPDIMVTEVEVLDFIKTAAANDSVLGSVGEGALIFIATGLIKGKKCTGNSVVDYMLKKIASFRIRPVVTDGNLVTARDTVDTPAFMRALCNKFDPNFKDFWKGTLVGKTALFVVGDDYEDIELIVPTMELLYRGAKVIIGRFEAQYQSRSAHLGSDFLVGNFGSTVPFQEIPDNRYTIKRLENVQMDEFDIVVIPGAFNPQNIVATGTTKWLRKAHDNGKLIAVLCHGPNPLAAADLVSGKQLTGYEAVKFSVEIMGGQFKPEYAAIIEGQIVSGRTPPEIPEFVDAISLALLKNTRSQ